MSELFPEVRERGLIDQRVVEEYAEIRLEELREGVNSPPGSNKRIAAIVSTQIVHEHLWLRDRVAELQAALTEIIPDVRILLDDHFSGCREEAIAAATAVAAVVSAAGQETET